ncbi:hypothetical protein ACFL2Q_00995 [Thermodesulfobacteriota bacterium]
MNILSVERFGEDTLIRKLRDITMLKAPEVKIYDKAFISLETVSVNILSPPQNYILRPELLKVRRLKWSLSEHDVDLFHLDGFVRLTIEGFDEPVDLLPPVVEESIEQDGTVHFIVNDGMHRVYMALREWVMPQVIFARGIPKHLPYYAFPVPGGWEKIEERDDLPDGYIKKWHRIENKHALYRDFNSAFRNVGGPRTPFEKK